MSINGVPTICIQATKSFHRQLASKAIAESKSLADFQRMAAPLLGRATPLPFDQTPASEIGLSRREIEKFSIIRACQAMVSKDWRHAQFELEASQCG